MPHALERITSLRCYGCLLILQWPERIQAHMGREVPVVVAGEGNVPPAEGSAIWRIILGEMAWPSGLALLE